MLLLLCWLFTDVKLIKKVPTSCIWTELLHPASLCLEHQAVARAQQGSPLSQLFLQRQRPGERLAVLAGPWGKTLIHNLCAGLLKRKCTVGVSYESQSNLKTPSGMWFRVGCDRDLIWWLEQEFWIGEGLNQKKEAEQEECSPEKNDVFYLSHRHLFKTALAELGQLCYMQFLY